MSTTCDITDDEREPTPALEVRTEANLHVERPTHRQGLLLVVAVLDVAAKVLLVVLLTLTVVDPSWGNLEGKAPVARALTYPLLAFALPAGWWLSGRRLSTYPWFVDLLITSTCFSDILGNRLDLYDSIVWFDDWMHFMNTALLSAAVVVLTLSPHLASPADVLQRGVAVGITMALGWEIFEYVSFVKRSSELPTAYADTIVDLTLGWLGSFLAALAVAVAWRWGRSRVAGR